MQLTANKCKRNHPAENIGIVFDMDGVIIDTCVLHEESWFHISLQYGFPWSDNLNFRKDIFGTSSLDSAQLLFGNRLACHDLTVLCNKKNSIYRELLYKNINQITVPGFLAF